MQGHHPDEPTFCVLDGEGLSLEGAGSHVQVGLDEEASDNGIGNNQGYNIALFQNK